MTDYPGYDKPQLVLDPGHTTGHRVDGAAIVRCNTCDRPVDTIVEHWTLITGRRPHADLRGVAYHDPDSDDAGACFTALRQCSGSTSPPDTLPASSTAAVTAGTHTPRRRPALRHLTPDPHRRRCLAHRPLRDLPQPPRPPAGPLHRPRRPQPTRRPAPHSRPCAAPLPDPQPLNTSTAPQTSIGRPGPLTTSCQPRQQTILDDPYQDCRPSYSNNTHRRPAPSAPTAHQEDTPVTTFFTRSQGVQGSRGSRWCSRPAAWPTCSTSSPSTA
jgi:hypothetical protein